MNLYSCALPLHIEWGKCDFNRAYYVEIRILCFVVFRWYRVAGRKQCRS